MPEQPRHLANKYEDIVNLQGRGILWRPAAQLVSTCAVCVYLWPMCEHVNSVLIFNKQNVLYSVHESVCVFYIQLRVYCKWLTRACSACFSLLILFTFSPTLTLCLSALCINSPVSIGLSTIIDRRYVAYKCYWCLLTLFTLRQRVLLARSPACCARLRDVITPPCVTSLAGTCLAAVVECSLQLAALTDVTVRITDYWSTSRSEVAFLSLCLAFGKSRRCRWHMSWQWHILVRMWSKIQTGASTPYKRWNKCTMEKVEGEAFCRNLGGSALIIKKASNMTVIIWCFISWKAPEDRCY